VCGCSFNNHTPTWTLGHKTDINAFLLKLQKNNYYTITLTAIVSIPDTTTTAAVATTITTNYQ